MWVKDAVPILSSGVSPLGWPESKVTMFLWPRSQHCIVAYVAAKPHKASFTFNKSVTQVQLNHHKYTSSHHWKTWQEYCRKIVSCKCTATLQKARQIKKATAVSHAAGSCAKCMHSCSFGSRQAALLSSQLLWNSMCTMLFSNARTAQILLLKGLGMLTKQSL